MVSITPCNHIFHYECIKKWIDDNVLNPLCPNCKYAFLDYLEKVKVINVKNDNINININKTNNNENNEIRNENDIANNEVVQEIRNNVNDIVNGINSREYLNINN